MVRSIGFVQDRLRPADTVEIQISLASDAPVEDPTTLREVLAKDVLLSGEVALSFDWIRDAQGTQVRSFPIAVADGIYLTSAYKRRRDGGCAA